MDRTANRKNNLVWLECDGKMLRYWYNVGYGVDVDSKAIEVIAVRYCATVYFEVVELIAAANWSYLLMDF